MSDTDSIPTDIDEVTSLVNQLRSKVTHQSLFIDQLLEQIKLARHQSGRNRTSEWVRALRLSENGIN